MATGIKRQLRAAQAAIAREIADTARSGGMYARGLACEGWNGGYDAALSDVMLALNGVVPDRWSHWERLRAERESSGDS